MSAVQTEIEESGIELAALSSAGKRIVVAAPTTITNPTSQKEEPKEAKESATSISDSYDAEIGEAVSVRLKKAVPATNLPLRVRVRKILSNKIARRTLQVAIAALVVTIVYNGINLVPAFEGVAATREGLTIQGKSEQNGRQGLAQGFIAECRGRKSDNLPLGPDCVKYLTKTPKAPPDIDKWMIDPPTSNGSTSILDGKDLVLAIRDVIEPSFTVAQTPKSDQSLGEGSWHIGAAVAGFLVLVILLILGCCWKRNRCSSEILVKTLLAVFFWGPQNFSRTLKRYHTRLRIHTEKRFGRRGICYFDILLITCGIVLFLYSCMDIWSFLQKHKSWSASSEFLDSCKRLQVLDLPLGGDCLKYMGKELKPPPEPSLSALGSVGFGVGIIGIGSLGLVLTSALTTLIRKVARRRNTVTLVNYYPARSTLHLDRRDSESSLSARATEPLELEHMHIDHWAFQHMNLDEPSRRSDIDRPSSIDLEQQDILISVPPPVHVSRSDATLVSPPSNYLEVVD